MSTAVVTGAASGIGFETARALAARGYDVVVCARDAGKAEHAVAELAGLTGLAGNDAGIAGAVVDLASLASVYDGAKSLLASHPRIDVLVNNAGVMATPFARTADGFELQFGTNHLGHFLLTNLLMPALLAAAPGARIVNVSSAGHYASDIDFDDPNYENRPYNKWEAYGQSKTANILFTVALEARLGDRGVHAYAVHPGMIRTQLGRHLTQDDYAELAERAKKSAAGGLPSYKSIEDGAATSVFAATAPELEGKGGLYLDDCQITSLRTRDDDPSGHEAYARDPEAAKRLWTVSEELVGESFAA